MTEKPVAEKPVPQKLEVEQKFPVADAKALVAEMARRGWGFGAPIAQADMYFNHPSRDFAVTDEALRIRCVGESNFVTYKGPKLDPTTKTRRELELPIAGGSQGRTEFGELLMTLGFRMVASVVKTRRPAHMPWHGRDVEIVLDDVTGLGTFAELELVVPAEQMAEAKEAILSLAIELKLGPSERRSYLEMLLASRSG